MDVEHVLGAWAGLGWELEGGDTGAVDTIQ